MGTLIVFAVVAAAVILAVRKIIKDKAKGKSACGCGCKGCSGCCK